MRGQISDVLQKENLVIFTQMIHNTKEKMEKGEIT